MGTVQYSEDTMKRVASKKSAPNLVRTNNDSLMPLWIDVYGTTIEEYRRASIWHPMMLTPPKDDTELMVGKFGPRGKWIIAPGPVSFNRTVKTLGKLHHSNWPDPEWMYWMPMPPAPTPPPTRRTTLVNPSRGRPKSEKRL